METIPLLIGAHCRLCSVLLVLLRPNLLARVLMLQMTEAELAERDAAIAAGKRVVDYLNSRRKAGKGFEYEVRWAPACLPAALQSRCRPQRPFLATC